MRACAGAGGSAAFLPADLASLAEVRRLAETVHRNESRLDILINNAGIGTAGSERLVSADRYELRFAVNYLAGFLLTRLLLPLMRKSTPARIVNVSSAGQQVLDFDDIMLTRGFSGARAYIARANWRKSCSPLISRRSCSTASPSTVTPSDADTAGGTRPLSGNYEVRMVPIKPKTYSRSMPETSFGFDATLRIEAIPPEQGNPQLVEFDRHMVRK